MGDAGDKGLLALLPVPGRVAAGGERVGAGGDGGGYPLAKALANGGQGGLAALVLDGIVQQRRDRVVLAGAVLQRQAGDRHQVGDVGNVAPLAPLVAVEWWA